MKYFLIAGERSGDLHGSFLINYLKKLDPEAEIVGWGGDYMEKAGGTILKHYRELAIMGFWEVIKNLRTLARLQKECKNSILEFNPDAVIFIDYPGFNLRIAAFTRAKGFTNFYYISPKVWAWNQKRAYKLKRLIDRLFCILPFEVEFFKRYEFDVSYVGNPLKEAIKSYDFDEQFLGAWADKKVIAVLPGSRAQEVANVVEMLKQIVPAKPEFHFLVAAVDNLPDSAYEALKHSGGNVELVYNKTYEILKLAEAAIVTSGTATLEAALLKAPQVVIYRTSGISYALAKRLIKVPFISLVNLIANKEVVRELIQDEMSPDNVLKELNSIVSDSNGYKRAMLQGYDLVDTIIGEQNAPEEAAREMASFLKQKKA
ncbi:lipid-A-disaccharide synthase [uncultured Imperialibacter sp.]|uniref:lipid-A-disaccharide synthase n=1 Tax=uncultured Imperialibacter sp. TaxID=1672639 RepID=UPI0030DCB1DF|tara:strand:- start:8199 stop:9317 length:1119 start_codon:yes stop_codon:yes gene_type:complete